MKAFGPRNNYELSEMFGSVALQVRQTETSEIFCNTLLPLPLSSIAIFAELFPAIFCEVMLLSTATFVPFPRIVMSFAVYTAASVCILRNLLKRSIWIVLSCCATIALSGCGSGVSADLAKFLVVSPGAIDFGSITVGGNANSNVILANSAPFPLIISQVSIAGDGFSIAGGQAMPLTIPAKASSTLKVDFAPGLAMSYSGQVTLVGTSTQMPKQVALYGQGSYAPVSQLLVSATSLDFGSAAIGEAVTRTLTLTCAGRVPVTIASATVQSSGFTVVRGSLPVTLSPTQTTTLQVQFDPETAGSVSGELTINSDASNGSTAKISLQGTGATSAPQLSLSTNSLNFENVTVGSPTTQPLTLTSDGSSPVTVTAATISGTGFTISGSGLPAVLNPGQSTTLQVQFNPTAVGTASGQVTINSNSAGGDEAIVSLSGMGIALAAPQLSLSNARLSFGRATVGSTTTQPLTLTSTGSSPVTVTSATITGASFILSNVSLPVVLNPGQSITLQVQFSPAAEGAAHGHIAIQSDSTNGDAVTVSLRGWGSAVAVPQLSLSSASLSFGNVTLNIPATQPLTLTSTGNAPVNVTAAMIAGAGLTVAGASLPAVLNSGQSITLQVQFDPAAVGYVTGQIVINSDSTVGAIVVPISGVGIAAAVPRLSVSAANLSFGGVTIGSPTAQPLTLTSTGSSPVTVTTATIQGDGFQVLNQSFPVTLTPGQSVTLQIQFNPAAAGSFSGDLSIASDSSDGGTVDVTLMGSSTVAVTPQLTLSTLSLGFGDVTVGLGAPQTLTLTSTGSGPVTVSSLAISGPGFSVDNNSLPATLNRGQSLTLQIQFKPTMTGPANGQLTVNSNSLSNGTAVVALSGNSTAVQSPQLSLSAASLAFGNVIVNTTAQQTITLTSSGTSAVTVNSATVTGPSYSLVPGVLPVTLNPGTSTIVQVQFDPAAVGTISGELTINSNSSSGSVTGVPLNGAGISVPSPQLMLNQTSLSFSNIPVNSSATQFITVTSTGSSPLTISAVSTSGASFSVVGSGLPATLNNGQSLTVQVMFQPTNAGSASGVLNISSNIAGGSTAVPLNGSAVNANPILTLSAQSLDFGSIPLNTPTIQSLTLTSTGQTAVTVNAATVLGAGFTLLGGSFPLTLNVGQTTTLTVQFDPLIAGVATGQLILISTNSGGATTVTLNGAGTALAHEVDLTWEVPVSSPDPVAGYHLYRSAGVDTPALVQSLPVTALAFADSTVISGTTYSYSVKSVDAAGVESIASNTTQAKIP